MKKSINYDIKVYNNNYFAYINNLLDCICCNKEYKNFSIIDNYKKFKINGLKKEIFDFDNLLLKKYLLNNIKDDKILRY